MALVLKDGIPAITTINGRRYAVCNEQIRHADGTPAVSPHGSYCGALIDVTDARQIRATDSCGKPENHVVGDDPVVG